MDFSKDGGQNSRKNSFNLTFTMEFYRKYHLRVYVNIEKHNTTLYTDSFLI